MIINKPSKTLSINNRLGKIVLFSIGTAESSLRVRLLKDGTLETLGRAHGGAWDKESVSAHPDFLAAVREYLMHVESMDYWYIGRQNVTVVSKRFATVKKNLPKG